MHGVPSPNHPTIRGRGAAVQPDNPYLSTQRVDDWEHVEGDAEYLESLGRPPTVYLDDQSQSIVATNDSPDVGFNYSVNPYRGCAHGCSSRGSTSRPRSWSSAARRRCFAPF
jgi:hypothetical protein